MALNLKDLMEKAESKGIKVKEDIPTSPSSFMKPWQQESVLFQDTKDPIKQKQEENCKQTVNINNKQTVIKLETNRNQSVIKEDQENKNRKQSVITTVNKTVNKSETNWKQTVNKIASEKNFSSLVGLQRETLILVYESCKSNRSKLSHPLTLEYVAAHLNTSTKTIKTTIQRLILKGYLERAETKNGRGGWTKYILPDLVYQTMLQSETVNKAETNRKQSVIQTVSTTVNKPLSSSSSNNINITTTTELPKNWLSIDISSLLEFGFTKNHLSQLYKLGTFSPEIIQDSIEHFSFDLRNNNKASEIKTNPLSYFMGILKRSGMYLAPANYESPKDRSMRIYLTKQKELKQKREVMENELLEIAFFEWEGQLSDKEREQLVTEDVKRLNSKSAKTSHLRQYFRENLWPEKRKKIYNEIENTQ